MARTKTNRKKNINPSMDRLISPAEDGHQFITVILAIIFSSLVSGCVAALLAYSIAVRNFSRPTPVYIVTPPEDAFVEDTSVTDARETVVIPSGETNGV